MKLKKVLISIIIAIVILAISTTSFADTAKNEVENKSADNKVSNSVSNKTKDDKNENKTTNTVKNETVKNGTKANSKNETVKNTTTKSKTTKSSSKTSTKSSKTETINEDVVNAESDDNLEYKDVTVNGNMFLANSDKITLNNVIVDGDVIAFANEIEIVDSEINGNVVAAGDKVTILNSEITSIYAAGENVRFDEGTVINRELRAAGQTVTINAKVNRDVYVGGETVKFGEDSIVKGKAVVRSENKSVSDDADIENLDYKKAESNGMVAVNISTGNKVISYLIGKGTEIAIILIIALFILYGFPKFSEVNASLRLRDFFKAFFTGLLEFIVIITITIGLFFTGYGVIYGISLLNLLFTFLILGKVIFVVSFAVRMSCGPEKISKVKAFFATVLVAIVLAVIEMISIIGGVGFIIDIVINCILAFTGLGSMFRVIFTSKKKLSKLSSKKLEGKNKIVETVPVEVIPEEEVSSNVAEEVVQSELQNEIKAEIKEEVEELKEEREEEKKLEESVSTTEASKVKEEKNEENENVEESKKGKKEDNK